MGKLLSRPGRILPAACRTDSKGLCPFSLRHSPL